MSNELRKKIQECVKRRLEYQCIHDPGIFDVITDLIVEVMGIVNEVQ